MIRHVDASGKKILILTDKRKCKIADTVRRMMDESDWGIIDYSDETGHLRRGIDPAYPDRVEDLMEDADYDLIVLVAPVHNSSYPWQLKKLLDYTDRAYLRDIPVAGILHAGGPRFGMVWDTMYYPWLRTIGMNVLPDHIYLDPSSKVVFENLDELAYDAEFLNLVVDPFLEGIEKVLNK